MSRSADPETVGTRVLPPTPRHNEGSPNDHYRRALEDTSYEEVKEVPVESTRPARVLIDLLNDFDEDALERVSKRSLTLKTFVKLPMLYLLLTAGMQSGLSIVFLKLFGELIQSGEAA